MLPNPCVLTVQKAHPVASFHILIHNFPCEFWETAIILENKTKAVVKSMATTYSLVWDLKAHFEK